MNKTWWLSFIDPERPQGARFLGVIILDAPTLDAAFTKSWELKINPGGEALGVQLNENMDEKYKNRLIVYPEVAEIGETIRDVKARGQKIEFHQHMRES